MFKHVIVISFMLAVIAFVVNLYVVELTLYYKFLRSSFIKENGNDSLHLFTNEKLSHYNGNIQKKLYLSILGEVYDVTKGDKHYGPGQSYHAFIGRDATKSFVTGDFNTNNLSDDVSSLSSDELLSLKQWKEFYDKEYTKKGKLIGRYFDASGNPTEYAKMIEKLFEEAEISKNLKQNENIMYPPCNIEWNAETGTRVWCTKMSGGIERDWIGYPVKFYETGSQSYRCACVNSYEEHTKIKMYDDCYLKSTCYINID